MNSQGNCYFNAQMLLKGEGDGSSFPSGGLRETCNARAYTVWDIKSEILFRNRNKTLYIPALLVSHDGQALDDKTLFRTC
jgi:glutamine synthetase